MKITEDVREYADKIEAGKAAELIKGMNEKASEFVKAGSEIYS